MLGVLRFWLERGVDGFRIDALRQVLKDPTSGGQPAEPGFRTGCRNDTPRRPQRRPRRPRARARARWREAIAEGGGVLVGELYLPLERLVRYYGAGVDMPSNMHLISTPWEPRAVAGLVERYEAALPDGAWPNWVLGNHDRRRVATRVGAGQERAAAYRC